MKEIILIYVASVCITLFGIYDLKRFESFQQTDEPDKYYEFYNRMYIYMLLLYIVPVANTILALMFLKEYLLNVVAKVKTAYMLWRIEKMLKDIKDRKRMEANDSDLRFQHDIRRRSLTDTDSQ